MSFENIHNLANKYFDTRKKHIDVSWLGVGNTLRRLVTPYSGVFKSLWNADIAASRSSLDEFRSGLNSSQATRDDLKDYLLHIKKHNFRVSDRNHLLILYPAFAAALILLIQAGDFGKLYGIILAVFGVLVINERAALHSQKIVNDELVGIIEREIERLS